VSSEVNSSPHPLNLASFVPYASHSNSISTYLRLWSGQHNSWVCEWHLSDFNRKSWWCLTGQHHPHHACYFMIPIKYPHFNIISWQTYILSLSNRNIAADLAVRWKAKNTPERFRKQIKNFVLLQLCISTDFIVC